MVGFGVGQGRRRFLPTEEGDRGSLSKREWGRGVSEPSAPVEGCKLLKCPLAPLQKGLVDFLRNVKQKKTVLPFL